MSPKPMLPRLSRRRLGLARRRAMVPMAGPLVTGTRQRLYGYLLLGGGGLYLLYLLTPILTPFLLAAGLAYLCDPLVDRLEARKVSRSLGTVLVLLGLALAFVLLLLILAPLVQTQIRMLVSQIPVALEWGQATLLPWLESRFGLNLGNAQAELMEWARSHLAELSRLTAFLPRLTGGGLALLGALVNLLLVPVVTFYLLRDWDVALAHVRDWLPREIRVKTVEVAGEVDEVLSQFVRGQLAVILVMALFYGVGLWLAGLDYALAVGLVSGILVFVPYLGVIVGVVLATLAGLVQYGDLMSLLPVWGVFLAGQLLEGMVVTPWLVGERVGLHPVAVIFALMAFGQLFGFFGVLLAIPASAALLVALRHLKVQLDRD